MNSKIIFYSSIIGIAIVSVVLSIDKKNREEDLKPLKDEGERLMNDLINDVFKI